MILMGDEGSQWQVVAGGSAACSADEWLDSRQL